MTQCNRPSCSPSSHASLVVDHLASNGLLQSLAVFLPESGLGITAASTAAAENDGKYSGTKTPAAVAASAAAAGRLAPAALSREDVLQGLTISEDSAMFRRVLSRASDREGASAVVMTTSAEVATGVACGEKPQRHVGGLLEAVMAEIAAKFRAVAVDSCAQTDEIGRSHKENLGELYVDGEFDRGTSGDSRHRNEMSPLSGLKC